MKPTIGRIVTYRDGQTDRPAIITAIVTPELVNLTVFTDDDGDHGCAPFRHVREDATRDAHVPEGTWRWPERTSS